MTTCSNPSTEFKVDGVNNADDLGDYINSFFATPPCEDVEFDGDETVNADDIGYFINGHVAADC